MKLFTYNSDDFNKGTTTSVKFGSIWTSSLEATDRCVTDMAEGHLYKVKLGKKTSQHRINCSLSPFSHSNVTFATRHISNLCRDGNVAGTST